MAKITFSKLGLKKIDNVKIIKCGDAEIEVKQYLPIEDKMKLVQNVINKSADENSFVNPIKNEVYGVLEIIYAYTNITFTEKQKDDAPKTYDLLEQNGIVDQVIEAIPESEYNQIADFIAQTTSEFYKYKTSVLGILEAVSTDYNDLVLDTQEIDNVLTNKENLTLVKDIITKLG